MSPIAVMGRQEELHCTHVQPRRQYRLAEVGLYDRSGDGKHCHKTAWGCIVLAYSVIAWGILCSRREDSGVAVQVTAMRRHL